MAQVRGVEAATIVWCPHRGLHPASTCGRLLLAALGLLQAMPTLSSEAHMGRPLWRSLSGQLKHPWRTLPGNQQHRL